MPTPQTRTGGVRGNASPKTSSAKPATKKTSSATTAAKPAGASTASRAKAKATGAGVAKTSRSQSPKTSTTTARKTTTAKPQTKPQTKAQAGSRAGAAGGQTKTRAGAGTAGRAGGATSSKARTKSKTSSRKTGASGSSQASGPMHDASAAIASYVASMKSNLKDWGIEIDTLKAKADQAGAGMRTEINRQIEMLHSKQQEASSRLQHLMEATGPAWRDLSRGIERAVRDLRTSLEKSTKTSK